MNGILFEMSKLNIILTGFMATGKTVVGTMLAEQMGYEFVDTDELIVKRSGMPIAEIFDKKGEAAFRRFERDLAQELGKKDGLVVSTGGGLMLDPANVAALSRRGRIFCLVATPEEIFNRVSNDKHVNRPLLNVDDPMHQIVEMMTRREEGYGRFPQIVTSGKTPEEVTRSLLTICRSDSD
jgi:shikimate kinase